MELAGLGAPDITLALGSVNQNQRSGRLPTAERLIKARESSWIGGLPLDWSFSLDHSARVKEGERKESGVSL